MTHSVIQCAFFFVICLFVLFNSRNWFAYLWCDDFAPIKKLWTNLKTNVSIFRSGQINCVYRGNLLLYWIFRFMQNTFTFFFIYLDTMHCIRTNDNVNRNSKRTRRCWWRNRRMYEKMKWDGKCNQNTGRICLVYLSSIYIIDFANKILAPVVPTRQQ